MQKNTLIYVDIENTLKVPFISGIQRVVRKLLVEMDKNKDFDFKIVPIQYCDSCRSWQHASIPSESLDDSFKKSRRLHLRLAYYIDRSSILKSAFKNLLRIKSTLEKIKLCHHKRTINKLESNSIFLDMDSSWHNTLKRSQLLPKLALDGIYIAKLHYDTIPIKMPAEIHPDNINKFKEHLTAHLEYCNLFVCISESAKKDLHETTDSVINSVTVRLGDGISTGNEIETENNLPYEYSRYILCVGTIEPRKNHKVLIDVFLELASQVDDLHLVCAGRYGWSADSIVREFTDSGLAQSRISWVENPDDKLLEKLYLNAFLCVVPSLYEGYGLPVSEALRYQCVTISSDAGALREAGGMYAEYFNPKDKKALYELIYRHVFDQKHHQMRKSRLKERPLWGWDDSARSLLTILKKNHHRYMHQ